MTSEAGTTGANGAVVSGKPRGRPRDPAVDDAILRAALELFKANGFADTSIDAVAKRAGVTRVTVYRRFAGKEELLAKALEQARGDSDAIEVRRLEEQDGSPRPAIERLVDIWVELTSREDFRVLLARLIGSAQDQPELMRIYWAHTILPRRESAKPAMRAMRAAGVLPADGDDDVLLDIMAGAVMYRMLVHPTPPTEGELRAHIRAIMASVGVRIPAD
ncbi:MAG TPA: TetR/AcrR family transcriptional regulator [Pseudonocardiaceae bacterium]|nr:TetR/AcrR family transcriptional regulator [Pseudonocardiaceae bacterium]